MVLDPVASNSQARISPPRRNRSPLGQRKAVAAKPATQDEPFEHEEVGTIRRKWEEEKQKILAEQADFEEAARRYEEREQGLHGELDAQEQHIAELTERLDQARAELISPEINRKAAEAAAGRMATSALLCCERDSLQEEVRLLKGQSNSLEDKVAVLSQRLSAAKAAASRGAQETEQLRRELQERRAERATLAGQQATQKRAGLEVRAQASALDEQVSRLAEAVEREHELLEEEQQRLATGEEQQQLQVRQAKQLSDELVGSIPARLEAHRAEAQRCEEVAIEGRKALLQCQNKLRRLSMLREQLVGELSRWKKKQLQSEAQRDTARASRLKAEADLAAEQDEAKKLMNRVEDVEVQHQQALDSQLLPLRESCSRLAEREMHLTVQEHLDNSAMPLKAPAETRCRSPQALPSRSSLPSAAQLASPCSVAQLAGSRSAGQLAGTCAAPQLGSPCQQSIARAGRAWAEAYMPMQMPLPVANRPLPARHL
eukprot:TRINITY_DN13109_c0_g1_i1.p1 TRINITY_DN13109_c0_g1~~TRINITY_DN13109_c0_g1_i1.p1  ORF type:complete len:499 (+),score=135.08 TRINITY_DN13109_c0_g1_i1:36-1499(+)